MKRKMIAFFLAEISFNIKLNKRLLGKIIINIFKFVIQVFGDNHYSKEKEPSNRRRIIFFLYEATR